MIKKESRQFNISVEGINCEKMYLNTWQSSSTAATGNALVQGFIKRVEEGRIN